MISNSVWRYLRLVVEARHFGAAVSALCEANRIAGFQVHIVETSGRGTYRYERLTVFSTKDLRDWVTEQRDLGSH